jgi:hypothetical protein
MDRKLFAYIDSHCPRFNSDVVNGLAVRHFKSVEHYIDSIIRCAEPGFPEGLRYVRYQRCTPAEEYAQQTAKRLNRQTYELARSDIYLVKYLFEYKGEELRPVYLFLPFIADAGLIQLLGSTFAVSPTLADRAISVSSDSIFIPLNRDKLTFKRLVYGFMCNGVREMAYVVWSSIYHAPKAGRNGQLNRRTVDVAATNTHYLFCKHGFTRTFAMANAEVVAGFDEINEQNYPPEQWKICESTKIKPRGYKSKFYKGTEMRLAIRNEQYTLTTQTLIASFFYIIDHFPNRVEPGYLDDVRLWKTLMGHVIFATNESEGKLIIGVDAHMDSLDGYVDGMVREWLREDGVHVQDIYELFMHIVETFSVRVTQSGSSGPSMYDKRLTVLRYVLEDIIKAIFGTLFALKKQSKKKQLAKADIQKIMLKELKPELIIRINRKHAEVASISSSTDNKYFKITSNLVLQNNSSGGTRSKAKAVIADQSRMAHASIAEVGSICNLPKSDPNGRNRVNPFVTLGGDGTVERDPMKVELIDRVQTAIQR